jgi:hypothetical protein
MRGVAGCPICRSRGWLAVPGFLFDARADCHCMVKVCNDPDCSIPHRTDVEVVRGLGGATAKRSLQQLSSSDGPMFRFTTTTTRPHARVRCLECGWEATGSSPHLIYPKADEHACWGLGRDR